MRKTSSDTNVDRRLVTNVLLSFLNTARGDNKRFEMLSLLSTILSWDDREREKAGLQRDAKKSGSAGSNAKKGAAAPTSSSSKSGAQQPEGRSAEEQAAMNEAGPPVTPVTQMLTLAELLKPVCRIPAEGGFAGAASALPIREHVARTTLTTAHTVLFATRRVLLQLVYRIVITATDRPQHAARRDGQPCRQHAEPPALVLHGSQVKWSRTAKRTRQSGTIQIAASRRRSHSATRTCGHRSVARVYKGSYEWSVQHSSLR